MATTKFFTGGDGASGQTGQQFIDHLNQVTSPTVFTTSGAGAVDDADVSLGSSTFGTDNYTVLQALLDEAANGPITIIWDGHYSISNVLEIQSNTKIIGLPGCGVILRDEATDQRVFSNANWVYPSASGGYGSNIVDENITIKSIIINGNNIGQSTQSNNNLNFVGVRNLRIEDCDILASNLFAFKSSNTEYLYLINCRVDHGSSAPGTNHDGLHVDGYSNWTYIEGNTLKNCDDDNIVIMAEEDANRRGPVLNSFIYNNVISEGTQGIRVAHGGSGFDIKNVIIDGLTGDTGTSAIRIHTFNGTTGFAENITIENIDVESSEAIISIPTTGSYRTINVSNIFRNESCGGSIVSMTGSAFINNLKISGISARFSAAFPVINITAGTIQRLQIDNAYFQSITGSNLDCPLVKLATGTVNTIQLSGITAPKVNRLVDVVSGTVTEIQAVNIHTPDVVNAFYTAVTVTSLYVSNYKGGTIIGGAGTFTTKRGSSLDYLGSLAFASLPSAATYPGSEVYVNNEADGATRAFSDGTNWISCKDGAAVTGP